MNNRQQRKTPEINQSRKREKGRSERERERDRELDLSPTRLDKAFLFTFTGNEA
jgi:hypothetical protein